MPDAIRWTIAFERNGAARLNRTIRFKQRVLPSEAPREDEEAGFWVELRDTQQRLVYRRVVDDPFRDEGPIDDRSLSTDRSPTALSRSVLSIVTPYVPGSSLVVVSSGNGNERARPVFTAKAPD